VAVSVAIVTVSSAVVAGEREDEAGALLQRLATTAGLRVAAAGAVGDERAAIEARLHQHVAGDVDVILTCGGTGLTPDDVTPEATAAVIERPAPGFAEALRAASLRHTPMGMLTRGESGIAGRTLIVNLPGSPRAVEQLFQVLAPVLDHAVATIRSAAGSRALHEAQP